MESSKGHDAPRTRERLPPAAVTLRAGRGRCFSLPIAARAAALPPWPHVARGGASFPRKTVTLSPPSRVITNKHIIARECYIVVGHLLLLFPAVPTYAHRPYSVVGTYLRWCSWHVAVRANSSSAVVAHVTACCSTPDGEDRSLVFTFHHPVEPREYDST